MIGLDITPNIDNSPWEECHPSITGQQELAGIAKIGLLPNGTFSGQPVVMIKMVAEDGTVMVGQTSWKLFRAAAVALTAAVDTYSMMEGVEDA